MTSTTDKVGALIASTNVAAVRETAKRNNERGKFLSHLNKACSGPLGDKLVSAFNNGDMSTLTAAWKQVTRSVFGEARSNGSNTEASVEETVAAKAKVATPKSLRDMMARYGELRAKGKDTDDPEVAQLGASIGKIRSAISKSLKGRVHKVEKAGAEETASDTEHTLLVYATKGPVVKSAGGVYVAIIVCTDDSCDEFSTEKDAVVDPAALQTTLDEWMATYDLRPDQVMDISE